MKTYPVFVVSKRECSIDIYLHRKTMEEAEAFVNTLKQEDRDSYYPDLSDEEYAIEYEKHNDLIYNIEVFDLTVYAVMRFVQKHNDGSGIRELDMIYPDLGSANERVRELNRTLYGGWLEEEEDRGALLLMDSDYDGIVWIEER